MAARLRGHQHHPELDRKVGKLTGPQSGRGARNRNYTGILGFPITFDDKGDLQGAQVYIYQVQGLGFEQVGVVSPK